jgi:hypothetical protein
MGARLQPPTCYTGTVVEWGLLSKRAKHDIRYPGQQASTKAKYYIANKSRINARNREYNSKNMEKTAATRKTYREEHKTEIAKQNKEYQTNPVNKSMIKAKTRRHNIKKAQIWWDTRCVDADVCL